MSARRDWWSKSALIVAVCGALFALYRNTLFKLLWPRPGAAFETTVGALTVQRYAPPVGVPVATGVLKLSLPISATKQGCETIYAVAQYQYPAAGGFSRNQASELLRPRYIAKFRYDLLNRRCESKDLLFDYTDLPESVEIVLVDVFREGQALIEHVRDEGVRIGVGDGNSRSALRIEALPAAALRVAVSHSTPLVEKFSWRADPGEVETIVNPYQSLRTAIVTELERRIQICRNGGGCDEIKVAVAAISDPEILRSFERAAAAGMPIEVITNEAPRFFGEAASADRSEKFVLPVTQWLRRTTAEAAGRVKLPMHTKFIVFGKDMVISSNGSYESDRYYNSREVALVYRSPSAVRIFDQIFAFIRSSLYLPTAVDLNDNVIILFNADRPRGYSASLRRPFTLVRTNEGVDSSAYGVLFEILRRSREPLSVAMTPLTNTCTRYSGRLCLFDLLLEAAQQGRLSLQLNAFFYRELLKPLGPDPAALARLLAACEERWMQAADRTGFCQVARLIKANPATARLLKMSGRNYSSHHERLALLGDRAAIVGSANWAFPSSINTIEVVQLPHVVQAFLREIRTAGEPYFVVPRHPRSLPNFSSGECEFVFERDLLTKCPTPPLKRFAAVDLRAELKQRYGISAAGDLQLLEPRSACYGDSEVAEFHTRTIAESFEGVSSYLCVLQDGRSHAIRIAERKSSQSP